MEMRMGALRFFLLLSLIMILASANLYGSGFSFEGIGVKASGMGGAFRAIADDWSAAYYNPAGYYQIQDNQLSVNTAFFHNRYWITKYACPYRCGNSR
jgi:long-subunit fatty acid transport protein